MNNLILVKVWLIMRGVESKLQFQACLKFFSQSLSSMGKSSIELNLVCLKVQSARFGNHVVFVFRIELE